MYCKQKLMHLFKVTAYAKSDQIPSIYSQDIEQKQKAITVL